MADTAFDLDPGEQRLRICAGALEDGQSDIEEACDTLLSRLADPLDLPDGQGFLASRRSPYAFRAGREDLCRRAARAALAVLLADDEIALPSFIDIAFDMPASEGVALARLTEELAKLVAQQRVLLDALSEELSDKRASGLSAARLIDLAHRAHREIASEASQRESSGNDEDAAQIRKLADDLRAALKEVAR